MLEEAERVLPLLSGGRGIRRCRGGREIEHGSREAMAREGECPREDEAQESQGRRTWRNPATVRPNRQRD